VDSGVWSVECSVDTACTGPADSKNQAMHETPVFTAQESTAHKRERSARATLRRFTCHLPESESESLTPLSTPQHSTQRPLSICIYLRSFSHHPTDPFSSVQFHTDLHSQALLSSNAVVQSMETLRIGCGRHQEPSLSSPHSIALVCAFSSSSSCRFRFLLRTLPK
jgi:hypothetical protein